MSDARRVPADGAPVGRRVFLGLVAAGAGAVAAGAPLSHALSQVQRRLAAHDPTGLSSLIPGGGWRYYTVTSGFPQVAADSYRLHIGGLVTNPLTLTLNDLAVRPHTTIIRDFQCVTGWRVPNVRWTGVQLAALLREVEIQPHAAAVQFRSFDGVYTESLTIAQAMRPDVLVTDTLGTGPVPREHGGPVRMLVAPMYGYKSCKWLSEIRVVSRLPGGYWEQYGYAQDGWVGRSNGRDDAPT